MGDLTLRDADKFDWDGSRDKIIELAGRGLSQAYISKAVGLAQSTVGRILRTEFTDRNTNRQKIVEAHAQTVQWLKLKITERMHDSGKIWDRRDAELLLKVLDREAKLFGTDQPVQSQVNVVIEDLSEEDLVNQLAAAGYTLQLNPPLKALTEPVAVEDAEYEPVSSQEPDGRQRTVEATVDEGSSGE